MLVVQEDFEGNSCSEGGVLMRFENKTIVVTGAGSGIGKAAVMRFASEGATVVLIGRTEAKLVAVKESVQEVYQKEAYLFPTDVTKEEEVEKLANYLEKNFGEIDILVNNAGASVHSKIFETTLEQWESVQKVNLTSVFLIAKHLAPLMKNENLKEDRSIVNVASLSGHKPGAHIPHYSSAKAGLINFTRALSLELAPFGIRVNSVSPGFVETPLTEKGLQNDRFVKAIERSTALKRVGKPEEIANIICFAASSEASYMTGSDLLVDGGWLVV
jgi:meso-butanediol dehydrogenase / (S,S)-butanediol dehydrogenase / diacetyl reductase